MIHTGLVQHLIMRIRLSGLPVTGSTLKLLKNKESGYKAGIHSTKETHTLRHKAKTATLKKTLDQDLIQILIWALLHIKF
jgi:hypothetical protein